MKYIQLGPKEFRCRPAKGWNALLNDCGMQGRCARRLAANVHGAPEHDLSRDAHPNPYTLGATMVCQHFKAVG